MSSCNSVKFHAELLNYIDIPVLDIHVCGSLDHSTDPSADVTQGNQKQAKRASTFFEFCNAEKGILLCTDGEQVVIHPVHVSSQHQSLPEAWTSQPSIGSFSMTPRTTRRCAA